jgi:hypothetical protein
MRYALLVRVTPGADPTPEEADPTAWIDEVKRRGMWVDAARLQDPPVATTVRVRDGRTIVTDGPFAEFKEYVAGVCLNRRRRHRRRHGPRRVDARDVHGDPRGLAVLTSQQPATAAASRHLTLT